MPLMSDRYTSFKDFYPFYLSQHQDRTCRRLHVVGSTLVLLLLALTLGLAQARWLLLVPLVGYGLRGWGTSVSSAIARPRFSIRSTA